MYKLFIPVGFTSPSCVINLSTNTFIPFDPANTDYKNFINEINNDEAQLQDAEGKQMSAAQAKAFVATLPQGDK